MKNQPDTKPVNYLPALESVRGIAAIYVVLHHISSNYLRLQGDIIGQPFRFGLEAVLAFFLLSGFVISHATEKRSFINWKSYIWLRFRRIYPIFIIAMALAYMTLCIKGGGIVEFDWRQLLGNLAMMHDLGNKPGVWFFPFAGNWPLWSLSYEMTFYVLYIPVMIFVPRKSQLWVVAIFTWCAVGMNQFAPTPWSNFVAFFGLWWVGVEMARDFRDIGEVRLRRQWRLVAILFPPFVVYVYLSYKLNGHVASFSSFPLYQVRFYGEAMGILILLPYLIRTRISGWLGKCRPLVWIGGISYALYALHFPIICNLPVMPGFSVGADLLTKLVTLFVIAWFVEKKLQVWLIKQSRS